MNQPLSPSPAPVPIEALPVPARPPAASSAARWLALGAGLLAVLTAAALTLAITTQQRVRLLERELVKRQQESNGEAAEARMLSRQAQDTARDAAAKVALLDARVSEAALQRSQLEELIQSLSRSRDENIVSDVETSLRVALQQTAITGSAEPLVATLKQSEDRLARYNQPRLERVRRAIAHDLDRVKAVGVTDISSLTLRLDEAVRQIDELPLLSSAEQRKPAAPTTAAADASRPLPKRSVSGAASAPAVALPASEPWPWAKRMDALWQGVSSRVWEEARTLVRVTRVDVPEAALLAPEQAFFLRENLKLRLLNARLALLSRQFDTAQSDLRDAQNALERYFDRSSRRVQATSELVRQVAGQARLVSVPRPDETLAALTAAGAGR
ncbi:uroporphyrinogen-III C-methyltransferase [Ideonella sp. BN130291]|uniref:uroporphyrinogen-III C-methyltransferase n=1 Tax=Ideonella sp. BN130291 TaxID=3112940 RepID=UPI002E273D6A|nr:uroporphyrinogen-III C-methyltransferase [Ideonella sp. BN130291]